MASLHVWREGTLPEKREQLYAETVDLLLDWWERPKTIRDAHGRSIEVHPSLAEWLKVDRDKIRVILNEIAYNVHLAQSDIVGTGDVVEKDLVSKLMIFRPNLQLHANPKLLVDYLSHRARNPHSARPGGLHFSPPNHPGIPCSLFFNRP